MSEEELRRAASTAAKDAARNWQVSQVPDDVGAWDHFYQHLADAVLAVPAIADALAERAEVRDRCYSIWHGDDPETAADAAADLADWCTGSRSL